MIQMTNALCYGFTLADTLIHWNILEYSAVMTFIAFFTPSKSLILITPIFVASC